jgi:ribokinase
MVGAVGSDDDGRTLLADLRAEGVDITHVDTTGASTGTALICVDPSGENQIVVAPGANAVFAPVGGAATAAQVLLASFEVPMPAVVAMAIAGHDAGAEVVINPAPYAPLEPELVGLDPILVPNEHELAQLAGEDALDAAIARLRDRGLRRVVVTRGAAGCLVADETGTVAIPPHRVAPVIDTTGAGDTFCGVLAAWLAGGATLREAAAAANVAAALSVRAGGARTGMPRREAIVAGLVSP